MSREVKIGDLVSITEDGFYEGEVQVGLVVEDKGVAVPEKGGEKSFKRVAVLWSDGDGAIDWEPVQWLNVLK